MTYLSISESSSLSFSNINQFNYLVLLKRVARAFYLSMVILPEQCRKPIGLAYLIARAADTLTDVTDLSVSKKTYFLDAIIEGISDPKAILTEDWCDDILNTVNSSGENQLLINVSNIIAAINVLPDQQNVAVKKVVETLVNGMRMDLKYFGQQDKSMAIMPDRPMLDQYLYHIAGCVGEFWTTILFQGCRRLSNVDQQGMNHDGVEYGKALQLINILRDIPEDLSRGRCYIPAEELSQQNLSPKDLLDLNNASRARRVLNKLIEQALIYYLSGQRYVTAWPRRYVILRLAALWPMLIGLSTLDRCVRSPEWLTLGSKLKISRLHVYSIMLISLFLVGSNTLLRIWIKHKMNRIQRVLRSRF